jgi:hypothetical protein
MQSEHPTWKEFTAGRFFSSFLLYFIVSMLSQFCYATFVVVSSLFRWCSLVYVDSIILLFISMYVCLFILNSNNNNNHYDDNAHLNKKRTEERKTKDYRWTSTKKEKYLMSLRRRNSYFKVSIKSAIYFPLPPSIQRRSVISHIIKDCWKTNKRRNEIFNKAQNERDVRKLCHSSG